MNHFPLKKAVSVITSFTCSKQRYQHPYFRQKILGGNVQITKL